MPAAIEGSAAIEWREHWPVVFAGLFGMGLSIVYMHSLGIMIAPLEREFGWSRAGISAGAAIVTTIACLTAPFMGMAIDRFGSRRIGLFGVIFMCASIASVSFSTSNIWTWWALWMVVALADGFVKPNVWVSAVSSLFSASRGLALAVILCGIGLGGAITPVAGIYLIDHYGWRMAYVGLAAMWGLVSLPLVYFFFFSAVDRKRVDVRRTPAAAPVPVAELTGVSGRDGILSFKFLKLALASSALGMTASAVSVNFVPILSSIGISRDSAAAIYSLAGVSSIVGRLAGGYLIDRFDASTVVAINAVLPAACCAILLAMAGSVPAAMIGVIIMGISIGVELDGVAYLTSRHFGLRNFGLLFGTLAGLLSGASGLGPLIANYSYDVTRSYELLLWAVIPVVLLAGLLFKLLGPYPDFARPSSNPGGE